MPERPFICTPSAWLYSPKLNRVSLMAEALFRRFAQCTDQDWKFSSDPLVIRGEAMALRPEIRLKDVVRALDELRASGALVYSQSGGREWLTVADDLRYHKGAHADARWGDPTDGALEQGQLPLVTDTRAPRPRKPRPAAPAAERAPSPPPPPPPVAPHVYHADAGDANIPDQEKIKLPRIAGEDGLMFDLGNLIGGEETILKGGIWRNRFREDRGAMIEAMANLKLGIDARRVREPALWLTDEWTRLRDERKSA